jgi:hypothetical protein
MPALLLLGSIIPLAAACYRESLAPDRPLAARPQRVVTQQALLYTDLDAAAARGTQGSLSVWVNTGGAGPRFAEAFISSVPVFGYARGSRHRV